MNTNNGNISRCENCHTGAGQFGAPIVSEHNENGQDIKTAATCILCHSNNGMYLNNNGTNGTTTAVGHYIKDVTNTATTPYLHNGPINTSNCIDCHNGAYTENTSWGSPVNISTSTKRTHTETRTSQCDLCHKDGNITSLAQVDFHNASLQFQDMDNCIGCHTTVTSADLGLHSMLNATSSVENGDCKTCHYIPFPMVKGAVNNSNTYFCADCHTPGSTNPKKSSINFTEKKHGEAACMDCHVADGKYHQGNPRGSVANSTYIARYTTANTNATDCADCHYAANLDDAPFNAPGGGRHISDNGGACATGGCHPNAGSNMIQTIHKIGAYNSSLKPAISVPALNSSSVIQGTDVSVTATVTFAGLYAFVDGAHYRIMSGTTEVRSWTPMLAADGNFNGTSELAVAIIATNITPGTYTIQVRSMAGGPAQNTSIRYYPINGDVSAINSTTLTILPPMGYINGTVTSGGTAIEGVYVSVSGVNDTSKSDGTYSLRVPEGTYTVNASKQPTHYSTSVSNVGVMQSNTTIVNISIVQKPTGTISGSVTKD